MNTQEKTSRAVLDVAQGQTTNVVYEAESVRPTWCEIGLDAIDHNVRQLRLLLGRDIRVFACMKSDAMGCGAVAVSLQCESSGADGLAFGTIDSAISCRQAGVRIPILLYPSCLPSSAAIIAQFDLMTTISTLDDVEGWSVAATRPLDVFLKIDVGGFRAGAFPAQALEVAKAIVARPMLNLRGIYGHVMNSYGHDTPEMTRQQANAFTSVISQLSEAGIAPEICMVSSSETVLRYPELDFNAVDPGRLLIGLDFPFTEGRDCDWHEPLRSIHSRIVMTKSVKNSGVPVAVPRLYAERMTTIGLVPIGWSDGYPVTTSGTTTMLVKGIRVPVVGPVHSELLRIDLSNVPDARVGDEVVILGRSGEDQITLDELGRQWGASKLDIYVGIVKRLPKIYRGFSPRS